MVLEAEQKEVDMVVVGLEKPKGVWSNFIMRQKLTFMQAFFGQDNENKTMGFWERIARAQSLSHGKEKSPSFYQDLVKRSKNKGRGGRGM